MKNSGISHGELSTLCLELSMLLHAGVGTGDALALLAEESDPEYQTMLKNMAREVDGGAPLSGAMRKAESFPVYVSGLVEVGERAGRTEEALAAAEQQPHGEAGVSPCEAGSEDGSPQPQEEDTPTVTGAEEAV